MTEQPQNAQPETVATDPAQDAEPQVVAPDVAPAHDDEDVPAALELTDTADGPGTDDPDSLPESDFQGFAESDVETDDNQEASQ